MTSTPTFNFNNNNYSSSSTTTMCCSSSSSNHEEIAAKLSEDFSGKLKLDAASASDSRISEKEKVVDEEERLEGLVFVVVDEKLPEQDDDNDDDEDDDDEEDEEGEGDEDEEEEEEFEFSFASTDRDGSPISAEDIFSNGEIRPVFPIFNRDLLFAGGEDGVYSKDISNASPSSLRPPLRRLFIEQRDNPSTSGTDDADVKPTGEYCVWSRKAVDASPEACKKSNSTGFSKLWRFRDLLHRSSSDGRDAFVFLNDSTATSKSKQKKNVEKKEGKRDSGEVKTEKKSGAGGKVKGKGKGATTTSAHEKLYVTNRKSKEGNRRRSYLPYRQDLVGFFTNVNGLSRNVHPF